jgi:hypothetical protein
LVGVNDADIAGGRDNACGVISLLQVGFNRDKACRGRDHPWLGFPNTWRGLASWNLGTFVVLDRYGHRSLG